MISTFNYFADELDCACMNFKGKGRPLCVGSNCPERASTQLEMGDEWWDEAEELLRRSSWLVGLNKR